jgi:hypothetical protein
VYGIEEEQDVEEGVEDEVMELYKETGTGLDRPGRSPFFIPTIIVARHDKDDMLFTVGRERSSLRSVWLCDNERNPSSP